MVVLRRNTFKKKKTKISKNNLLVYAYGFTIKNNVLWKYEGPKEFEIMKGG